MRPTVAEDARGSAYACMAGFKWRMANGPQQRAASRLFVGLQRPLPAPYSYGILGKLLGSWGRGVPSTHQATTSRPPNCCAQPTRAALRFAPKRLLQRRPALLSSGVNTHSSSLVSAAAR
jgi:hypothetical protein